MKSSFSRIWPPKAGTWTQSMWLNWTVPAKYSPSTPTGISVNSRSATRFLFQLRPLLESVKANGVLPESGPQEAPVSSACNESVRIDTYQFPQTEHPSDTI
jgi:hypothetical protein